MANRICPCGYVVAKGAKCDCAAKRATERQRKADAARPSASARGYTAEWTRESKAWLAARPDAWCACGCGRPADMVDHIRAPKGNMQLFWDRNNWQPFNRGCNSRKNIKSEGGFGRTA